MIKTYTHEEIKKQLKEVFGREVFTTKVDLSRSLHFLSVHDYVASEDEVNEELLQCYLENVPYLVNPDTLYPLNEGEFHLYRLIMDHDRIVRSDLIQILTEFPSVTDAVILNEFKMGTRYIQCIHNPVKKTGELKDLVASIVLDIQLGAIVDRQTMTAFYVDNYIAKENLN
jgi:copper chaperone CopZ